MTRERLGPPPFRPRGATAVPAAPCPACGAATRIVRTHVDPRHGHVTRRRECVACGTRHTTRHPPPVPDRPPLTAAQASRIDRRSRRIAALAARAAVPTLVTFRDGPDAIADLLPQGHRPCGSS